MTQNLSKAHRTLNLIFRARIYNDYAHSLQMLKEPVKHKLIEIYLVTISAMHVLIHNFF